MPSEEELGEEQWDGIAEKAAQASQKGLSLGSPSRRSRFWATSRPERANDVLRSSVTSLSSRTCFRAQGARGGT
jgi:hypothetical protein